MAKPIDPKTVQRAAEELLLAFVQSDEARVAILDEFSTADRFPWVSRPIYAAALRLYAEGKALTVTGLAAAAGTSADDLVWLENGAPLTGQALQDQMDIAAAAVRYQEVDSVIENSRITLARDGADAALAELHEGTLLIAERGGAENADGGAMLDELDAVLADPARPGRPTGLVFMDALTLGLLPGMVYVLGGPYKQRKSTIGRNLTLGLLARGTGVGVYLYEATRLEYAADLLAMVANAYLIDTDRPQLAALNRLRVMSTRRWSPAHHEALEAARRVLRELTADGKLRVYDVASRRIRIHDQREVRMRIRTDRVQYGTVVTVLDNADNIHWRNPDGSEIPPQDYTALAATAARWCMDTPKVTDTALFALWQYRESEQETDGAGAGLRGGTAIAAVADFVFQTRYDQDKDSNHLVFSFRRSRHAPAGDVTQARVRIDPVAGMMLAYAGKSGPESWDGDLPLWIVPRDLMLNGYQPPAGEQAEMDNIDLPQF